MSYLDNVKANLFPLSIERENLKRALAEWEYHGEMEDLGVPCENCEMCEHPNIRYQFEIINKFTKNTLLVGSECITKFPEIGVVTDEETLYGEEAAQKVRQDKTKLIEVARRRKMMTSLVELARKDTEFQIESFINYVSERGAFTPKQITLLMWRFKDHHIEHDKSLFKVTVRRNREKAQLLEMEKRKVKEIWPCLSASQRGFYIKERGMVE